MFTNSERGGLLTLTKYPLSEESKPTVSSFFIRKKTSVFDWGIIRV